MATAITRIIEAGRLTVPADVRRDMDLQRGDYVRVELRKMDPEEAAE